MTSDVFWEFLTYLPTLIRYFTTQAYLVKSDAAKNLTSYVNAPLGQNFANISFVFFGRIENKKNCF